MATRTVLLGADDLERLGPDFRGALIDGVLVEMAPPGPRHGGVAASVTIALGTHVRRHRLGQVLTEAGFILRRNPDTVRAPDVAFILRERIPPGGLPVRFWELAPDLVVEVVSPSDTPAEIQAKVRDWLEAGARRVWVLYPDTRTVHLIRSLQERVVLTSDDTLEGEEVVPGFSCPVRDLFE